VEAEVQKVCDEVREVLQRPAEPDEVHNIGTGIVLPGKAEAEG
jgi:hypothetical protein